MQQNFANGRQLACIMFTDIVGYTLLMGEDESKAFETLKENRAIHQSYIAKYGGRWIKEIGDGVLATFSNVTDAVLAAASIRQATIKSHYELRIGLHLSEVVFENNDVFGDGVNIASRIQSVAAKGAILISESVQKNLSNKKGIETIAVAQETLKHIKEAMNLYEIVVTKDFLEEPIVLHTTKVPSQILEKSIAILPFRNLSADADQDYFSEGITEEIIVSLSNIKELKVMGRSSSFQFKDKQIPVEEIGKMLGVTTILEGSVRRIGQRLRIHASLINTEDGCHVWAEKYDREMVDIFQIQDDIAENIAQKLKVTFLNYEDRNASINMEAYELLLKGRFYMEKYIEGFEKAMVCFSRAVEIDSSYGEAWCELAKVNFLLTMNLFFTPKDGFEKAKFYAEKALSVNKELGGAHYILGQIHFWYKWDFEKAKKSYELAQKCKDSFYFTGVVFDPWLIAFGYGDYQGAIDVINKIIERDPLSFYAQLHLGYFFTFNRQSKMALEVLNRILEMVPEFSEAERLIAYNYLINDENELALEHGRKAAKMAHGLGWAQNTYIIALAKNGRKEEALHVLNDWRTKKGPLNISPVGVGLIYAFLGDMSKAFECFYEGVEYRDMWLVALKYCPDFDVVRNDPRYPALLETIAYPKEKMQVV